MASLGPTPSLPEYSARLTSCTASRLEMIHLYQPRAVEWKSTVGTQTHAEGRGVVFMPWLLCALLRHKANVVQRQSRRHVTVEHSRAAFTIQHAEAADWRRAPQLQLLRTRELRQQQLGLLHHHLPLQRD